MAVGRREFLVLMLALLASYPLADSAHAKDGDSGGDSSGSGSSNSGSGSDSDSGGQGRGRGRGGDDDDGEEDDVDEDDDSVDNADQKEATNAREKKKIKPLREILDLALTHTPGRVLDVSLRERSRDRYIYRIKILSSDGRKRELQIDGSSGRVLRVK